MKTEKSAKVATSNRIHPDNYIWLKEKAAKMERSANWLLDKVITEARMADENSQEDDNAYKQ